MFASSQFISLPLCQILSVFFRVMAFLRARMEGFQLSKNDRWRSIQQATLAGCNQRPHYNTAEEPENSGKIRAARRSVQFGWCISGHPNSPMRTGGISPAKLA